LKPNSSSEPSEPALILDPKIAGNILMLELRDEGDEHPTKMQIELKGESRAELSFIDMNARTAFAYAANRLDASR
jgi:hypothetical protein